MPGWPVNNHDRSCALRALDSDLNWLLVDDHWNQARKILADSTMQAAVVAAARFDRPIVTGTGIEHPDPTGREAINGTAAEIRSGQVVKAWQHQLNLVAEHLWFVCDATSALIGEPYPPAPARPTVTTLVQSASARVSWLLLRPQCRLERAVAVCESTEWLNELDHAIEAGAAHAQDLRSGRMDDEGKRIPSVHFVIHEARRAVEAKPKEQPAIQRDRLCCRNCSRFGFTADVASGSSSLCSKCIEFRKANGVMPTEAICRRWDDGHRGWTPAQLIEAKAQGKAKRKVKAS